MSDKNKPVKPFLKWAGGKSQLLEQIQANFPAELKTGSIARYIEPFVGSGAVFFYVSQYYSIEEFFISDINPELIIAYKTIQKNVEELIENLSKIQEQYVCLDEEKRKEYFYQTRSEFNLLGKQIDAKLGEVREEWIKRTAQLIFLNRTCFNGLFRVNSKGEFNVPFGKYKNPKICDRDNLRAVSQVLQKTHIHHGDFTDCEKVVDKNSFVYFDPPYKPITKTSNFTSYSKDSFDDKEQLRLRDFFSLLDKKGAKLMLSNSDPRDNFFETAYERYRIERVKASRNINSNAQKRGKINELLIMNNYPTYK
ncbi:MAG: DNA adenine methylase [Prochloraceae cyanobacterium]|nr:DNA adenine methylase [Prochloraceae cyanobacterium]